MTQNLLSVPQSRRRIKFTWTQIVLLPILLSLPLVFGKVSELQTMSRVAIVYFFILISIRLMGKRELSQLSPFELVMLMIIPELVSQSLNRGQTSVTNGLIGVSALLFLVFLTSIATYRFKIIEKLVDGEPVVVFKNGNLVAKELDLAHLPTHEIVAEMRKKGIENLNQVKWVVLETDGKLSIIPFQTKS